MSNKMPGGFNTKSARDHQISKWNIQTGRQDSILLAAISQKPQARLANTLDAKQFLDALAQQYILAEKLTILSPNPTETNDASLQLYTSHDPVIAEQLNQSHKDQKSPNLQIGKQLLAFAD